MSCIDSNCSSASTSAVLSHAVTINIRIVGNRGLQLKNNFVCRNEGRTGPTGAKSSFNQGKINNFCISSVNNSFQCFFKRMGSFLPRAQNCRIMNIVRKQMSCKCFGIEGRKIWNSERSSRPEVFCKKGVLKILRKTPVPESLF